MKPAPVDTLNDVDRVEVALLDGVPRVIGEGKAGPRWECKSHRSGEQSRWRQKLLNSLSLQTVSDLGESSAVTVDSVTQNLGLWLVFGTALRTEVAVRRSDWRIARAKSPRAAGKNRFPEDMAPTDSPKMVTLCGSPPKWRMLSRTHLRART